MANTGYAGYRILEEYDVSTNQPTGKEKFNLIGDSDYVAPTQNLLSCPIPNVPITNVSGNNKSQYDVVLILTDGTKTESFSVSVNESININTTLTYVLQLDIEGNGSFSATVGNQGISSRVVDDESGLQRVTFYNLSLPLNISIN